ncbi:hypothetical protein ACFXI3_21920, partial [Amycolatopsis sp. NPDC059235]|uniref:hypothetical protein n=1 Tax=Amycolatopsis sp. NPDC059235 TaxID=3346782 RepID=UPI003670C226
RTRAPAHPRTRAPAHPRTRAPAHPRTRAPAHPRTETAYPTAQLAITAAHETHPVAAKPRLPNPSKEIPGHLHRNRAPRP